MALVATIICVSLSSCGDDADEEDHHGSHQVTMEGYVDLGLPSGVLWAACNLGASSPEEYGDYYAWGETSPKEKYDQWTSLTWNKTISDFAGNPQYDAATANCGKGVRLPTLGDINELLVNTTTEWTEFKGVKGRLVTSKKNGASIFLPAAGCRREGAINNTCEYGTYWSSTPIKDDKNCAYVLDLKMEYCSSNDKLRFTGYSVRPVREK